MIITGLKMKMMSSIGDLLNKVIPDPKCELNYNTDYQLLIAVMLSAQTTDKRVNEVTKILFDKYRNLRALSEAKIEDIENILRPLGSFRKKALYVVEISKIIQNDCSGMVPTERGLLEKLPGVGRKTVSVFLSEFYEYPEFAVDTHVERVSKRLGIAKISDDVLTIEKKLKKYFPKEEWAYRHKQLVLFGRYHCKAVNPECSSCLLNEFCKYEGNKKNLHL